MQCTVRHNTKMNPGKYRWRPVLNAAKFGSCSLLCSNTAKTRNLLKIAGVPQTRQQISAGSSRSSPYCGDMWRRYCYLTSFFLIVDTCLSCEDIARQSCAMVPRRRLFGSCISSEPHASGFRPAS